MFSFDTFGDILEKAAIDCNLLQNDMQAIINAKRNNTQASRKSIEPITRLRKSIEELKSVAQEDPDTQFISDKFKDIVGSI